MRVRRCAIVTFEPHERLAFRLGGLAEGGSGLERRSEWSAFAPHLLAEVTVTREELTLLGELSPTDWSPLESLCARASAAAIDALLDKSLLVAEDSEADRRDRRVRDTHWRGFAATMHYASRWRGVDTEALERQYREISEESLLDRLGPPPPPVRECCDATRRLPLPAAEDTPLDALLARRVTCRNFDRDRALSAADFAAVLQRAFGARAVEEFAPGVHLLKKGVPSAGGLHATEAYLLVQRVEGIDGGLYHYHPIDHALEPIRALDATAAASLAARFVAAQPYFVDAPVIVVPVVRFRRNFWKYRNHAKAYRALILDVGHLSQTLYLAATELGLAAFVTAAINEVDIEEAFGLDALEEGPLAVMGFGHRAGEKREIELDPLNAVWPPA